VEDGLGEGLFTIYGAGGVNGSEAVATARGIGIRYIAAVHQLRARQSDMEILDRIEQTLDTLRPYIASHRGNVEVVDFDEEEGRLLLRLGGTCHGCAASTITLKQGIEVRLRQAVPEGKTVEAV
jgi:Fe-S cluster biogenesis protein NfuA